MKNVKKIMFHVDDFGKRNAMRKKGTLKEEKRRFNPKMKIINKKKAM
jgi:hypothetical protein